MAIALVQQAGDTGGTPRSPTFSAATAGNLIVLYVSANTTSLSNFQTPTGYTSAVGLLDSGGAHGGKIFYKTAAGGETSVSVAVTSAAVMGVRMVEVSGIPVPTLDKTATNDPAGTGTTCQTGSTGTLGVAAEFAAAMVACDGNWGGSGQSWDSGFTATAATSGSEPVCGYLITSATTALNPQATWTNTRGRVGMIATFKSGAVTVDSDTDLRWAVSGVVDSDTDLRWGVAGSVDSDTSLQWYVAGPVPTGWTVRTEADWGGDPLTRPASMTALTSAGTTLSTKRGTQILQAGIETGTGTRKLDNSDRKLDPSNAASSLYPNVKPRTRMRDVINVGGTDHVLHTGFAERFPIEWSQEVGYCTVTTQDQLGLTATATLPASVYDWKVRDLAGTHYWPMLADQVDLGVADDVIGSSDGTYTGPVTRGDPVVPYDLRAVAKFARPQVDNIDAEGLTVSSFTASDEFTFSWWFKWDVNTWLNTNPAMVMLQNASVPTTDPPGSPNTPNPTGIIAYLAQSASFPNGERMCLLIRIQDGSNVAVVDSGIRFKVMDGKPHHLAFSVKGSTKTIYVAIDGQPATATLDIGPQNRSTINISSVIAASHLLSCGWGIDWQDSTGTASSASVGQLAYFPYQMTNVDGKIAALYTAGASAWDGDTTAARLTRVHDWMGVDPADRNTYGGSQICGPTLLNSQNAQTYIKKILATELSELYIDADGKWTFPARADYGTIKQVFSDNPSGDGGAAYSAITVDFSYDRLVNDITIGRENGADQEVTDATSIAAYGPIAGTKYRTGQAGAASGKLDTLHQTATAARTSAQWLIDRHKDPVVYIPAITVSAIERTVSLDTMLLEIGDTVVVYARPPGGGSPIGLKTKIESVAHNITGLEWTVTYALSDGVAYP